MAHMAHDVHMAHLDCRQRPFPQTGVHRAEAPLPKNSLQLQVLYIAAIAARQCWSCLLGPITHLLLQQLQHHHIKAARDMVSTKQATNTKSKKLDQAAGLHHHGKQCSVCSFAGRQVVHIRSGSGCGSGTGGGHLNHSAAVLTCTMLEIQGKLGDAGTGDI